MYVQKGDLVRIFTVDKRMMSAEIVTVYADHIECMEFGSIYEIGWNDVVNILPQPHPDPNHMFDKYDLVAGDEIAISFYDIAGEKYYKIGTFVSVNGSVIVLQTGFNGGERYEIFAPFNLLGLVFYKYSTLRAKKSIEKEEEKKNEEA